MSLVELIPTRLYHVFPSANFIQPSHLSQDPQTEQLHPASENIKLLKKTKSYQVFLQEIKIDWKMLVLVIFKQVQGLGNAQNKILFLASPLKIYRKSDVKATQSLSSKAADFTLTKSNFQATYLKSYLAFFRWLGVSSRRWPVGPHWLVVADRVSRSPLRVSVQDLNLEMLTRMTNAWFSVSM